MASRTGWPRGRTNWVIGSILVFAGGALFGLIWGSVGLGLAVAAAVSIGWLLAYAAGRGQKAGLTAPNDAAARL